MSDKGGWDFLLPLLPAKLRPYAKAVFAFIPALAYALVMASNALADAGLVVPSWLAALVTMVTALAVYEVPNQTDE